MGGLPASNPSRPRAVFGLLVAGLGLAMLATVVVALGLMFPR